MSFAASWTHYPGITFRHFREKRGQGLPAVPAENLATLLIQVATHSFLVYRADFPPNDRADLAGEVKVDILLRRNGHAVHGGRAEAPVAQHRQHFVFNAVAKRLQDLGFGYVALGVDGDFYHHVADDASWYFRSRDHRIGENYRQCRPHFMAGGRSVRL